MQKKYAYIYINCYAYCLLISTMILRIYVCQIISLLNKVYINNVENI